MPKNLGLDKYSALYLWGAFMLYFGLTQSSTFLTGTTFKLVLTEKVIVAVLGLGFLIPLATGTFDLSIGAVMAGSLAVANWLGKNTGLPAPLILLLALGACIAIGFVNGFVVVRLGVNSFIATLGMSQLLSGVVLYVTSNRQITGAFSNAYRDVGRAEVLGMPLYFYYLVMLSVVIWYVLEHTPLGRYLFAIGGNPDAARLAGVRTDRYVWGSLMASAVMAGLAGVVFSWKVGTFSQSVGPGYLFPAVAAVFFGASQLKGRANVWGTLIALYALSFGIKGLQLTFANNTFWIEPLFEGLTLIAAVALASRKGLIRVKRRRKVPAIA